MVQVPARADEQRSACEIRPEAKGEAHWLCALLKKPRQYVSTAIAAM
jgi:hypothetical protein